MRHAMVEMSTGAELRVWVTSDGERLLLGTGLLTADGWYWGRLVPEVSKRTQELGPYETPQDLARGLVRAWRREWAAQIANFDVALAPAALPREEWS
jgi:hypothetical protein